MLDLSRLSPAQRACVVADDGPLLFVAGPGSGKTTVLAARVAYLVDAAKVRPDGVLAITFATKAAHELRARLAGLLGADAQYLYVSTLHALGLRIVRQWSEELGYGPGPLVVYGDGDARAALRLVAEEQGLDLERFPLDDLVVRVERYRLGGDTGALDLAQIQPLAEAYARLLRRRGAVDFAAMLALPLRLFAERPTVLQVLQDAYGYVLCDEFQDLSASQYALVRNLAAGHRNLTAVGDPAQVVYGWRGADARFMRAFQLDFPEARLVRLTENFRSTRRIVEAANALGAHLREHYPLETANPAGDDLRLYPATNERDEASFIVDEITRLRDGGFVERLGEIAVLFRTNHLGHELALAFRQRRIPYRVPGRGDLFRHREVQDALAYLRLAHHPGDAAALDRIASIPLQRSTRARTAIAALGADLQTRASRLSPAQLLDLALDLSGYRAWVAGQPDGPSRVAHLVALRDLAGRAVADLATWLADIALGEDAPSGDEADQVVLSTVHAAKGGEWRVVFVVGMEEGLLPHARALLDPDNAAIEGEEKVAYVALTRARARLYVSYCRNRSRGDRSEERQPSRFLQGLSFEPVSRAVRSRSHQEKEP